MLMLTAYLRVAPILGEAGALSWWRGPLALLLGAAGLAVGVGAAGWLQRWTLARQGRTRHVGLLILAIACGSASLLWAAARVLRLVNDPVLGFVESRPFFQGLAKAGLIAIFIAALTVPLMAFIDRMARFGLVDARRAMARLGGPALLVILVGLILFEPLQLHTDNPRPQSEDIVWISPLKYMFGLMAVVITAIWGAAWATVSFDEGDGRSRWKRYLPLGSLGSLLVTFVCICIAFHKPDPADVPVMQVAGLGGSADQGIVLLFVRWAFVFAVCVAACRAVATYGLRKCELSEEEQQPIGFHLPTREELFSEMFWNKRGGESSAATAPPQQSSSAGAIRQRSDKSAPIEREQPVRAPSPVRSESADRVMPFVPATRASLAQDQHPKAPPPVPAARTIRPTSSTSEPPTSKPAAPAWKPPAKGEEWTPLPIDPKTGLIREDVAQQVQRELEADAGLIAMPRGRSRSRPQPESPLPPPPSVPVPIVDAREGYAAAPEGPARTQPAAPEREWSRPVEPTLARGWPVDSAKWGWVLLVLGFGYAAMALYGSLLPFHYRSMSFAEAWDRLMHLPAFDVHDNPNRRADFVANIALFIPVGFLLLGSLCYGRRSVLWRILATTVIAALSVVLAYGIEFSQFWFPPRTTSMNDVVAQHVGAAIGMVAWWLVGTAVVSRVIELFARAGSGVARKRLLQLFAAGLFLFCLLPMDFTLSPGKIFAKIQSIRMGGGLLSFDPLAIGRAVRDLAIFIPVGVLAYYRFDGLPLLVDKGRSTRTPQLAAGFVLIYAAIIEGIKIFMVNGVVDLANLPIRALSGFLGAIIAGKALSADGALRLTMDWPRARRVMLSLAGIGVLAIGLIAVLAAPWRMVPNSAEFWRQVQHLKTAPFSNYYYAGEWTALTNLTHFALLFVPLGVLLRWGLHRDRSSSRGRSSGGMKAIAALAAPIAFALVLGVAIEMMQAMAPRRIVHVTAEQVTREHVTFDNQAIDVSEPALSKGQQFAIGPTPDSSDVLAYVSGAVLGWLMMGLFLPFTQEELERPAPSQRDVQFAST